MIKKSKGKWVILSKDGLKRLGEFNSYREALHRLQVIEYYKNIRKR